MPPIIGDSFASNQLYNGYATFSKAGSLDETQDDHVVKPDLSDMLNFVRLIANGELDVNRLRADEGCLKVAELSKIVSQVNPDALKKLTSQNAAKLRTWLLQCYDLVLGGNAECHVFQKVALATGGVLEASCPHGFKIAHMHLMDMESVRHVLAVLRSLLIFPRLVVYDASCGLATHLEGAHPEEARQLLGANRGCFRPWQQKGPTSLDRISIEALSRAKRLAGIDNDDLRQIAMAIRLAAGKDRLKAHPFSFDFRYRLLLTDRFHQRLTSFTHKLDSCLQHLMSLCEDLDDVATSIQESLNQQANRHLRSLSTTDAEHHIFYTHLLRQWHNEDTFESMLKVMNKETRVGEIIQQDKVFGCMRHVCSTCRSPGHAAHHCPEEASNEHVDDPPPKRTRETELQCSDIEQQ